MKTLTFQDRGSGATVVFLHGFPFDSAMWRPQLDSLAASHRVLVPDLPGFGGSPAIGAWTIDGVAKTIADWLDAIGVKEPIALAGLSMGGYLALSFTRQFPHRLRKLILADTKADPDDAQAKEGRNAMIALVNSKGSAAVASAMLPKLVGNRAKVRDAALLERVHAMMSRQCPCTVAAAIAALRDRPDATSGLLSIAVPTLVVVGAEDALTPVEKSQFLAGKIPGAKLEVIEGAGHLSNLESPARFNAALSAFL